MKNIVKFLGIIAFIAVIGFTMTGCPTDAEETPGGGGGGIVPPPSGIGYTVAQIGGTADIVNSTGIVFTFAQPIDDFDLTVADITVTGAASKNGATLTNTSTTTRLLSPIIVTAAGEATVTITKDGIDATPQFVVVYKKAPSEIDSVTITVTPVPTPPATAQTGDQLSANVVGGAAILTFQWNLEGVAIPNAVNRDYLAAEAGSYTVTVGGGDYLSKTSEPVTVGGAALTPLTGNLTIRNNSTNMDIASLPMAPADPEGVLRANYTGTETVAYQWYLNGEPIPSPTGIAQTFTPGDDPLYGVGSYNVTVTGPAPTPPDTTVYASKTSNPVIVHAVITFNPNLGNWSGSTTTITRQDTDVVGRSSPVTAPTRARFTFAGWYDADDGTGDEVDFQELITDNTEVFAMWQYALPLTSIADVADYLGTPLDSGTPTPAVIGRPLDIDADAGDDTDNPIALPVKINLGITQNAATNPLPDPANPPASWANLLVALDDLGLYVALDLSESTMNGAEFNNPAADDGKEFIVSLTLPTAANAIAAAVVPDPFVAANVQTTFVDFENLSTLEAARVGTVGTYAFYGYEQLTSVSFPGATTISDNAFEGCTFLASVSFPNVTSIGDNAFDACTGLITVTFPKATAIGEEAFTGCTGLTNVSLPAAYSIDASAFSGCAGMVSLSFPNATSIAAAAFENCTGLGSVSLPAATSIDQTAFHGCTGLTSVSFPEATVIGDGAFSNSTSLTSVNIPKATSIGDNAFIGCTSLSSVTFPAVTTIGVSAFEGCKSLTSVTFPVAITIGESAFQGCKGLTSVSFPNTYYIDASAFEDCTSIRSVSFPNATRIRDAAFKNCDSLLGSVSFPTVRTIGDEVFNGTKLTSVSFPTVYTIGADALPYNISSITIANGVRIVDEGVDNNGDPIANIVPVGTYYGKFIAFYEDDENGRAGGTYGYNQVTGKWSRQGD